MKTIKTLTLAFVAMLFITACNNTSGDGTSASDTTDMAPAADNTIPQDMDNAPVTDTMMTDTGMNNMNNNIR